MFFFEKFALFFQQKNTRYKWMVKIGWIFQKKIIFPLRTSKRILTSLWNWGSQVYLVFQDVGSPNNSFYPDFHCRLSLINSVLSNIFFEKIVNFLALSIFVDIFKSFVHLLLTALKFWFFIFKISTKKTPKKVSRSITLFS